MERIVIAGLRHSLVVALRRAGRGARPYRQSLVVALLAVVLQPLAPGVASDEVNAVRRELGLSGLQRTTLLNRIAATRAKDMVERNYFAHVDPRAGHLEFASLLRSAHYHYRWAGEILCRAGQVDQCYSAWLKSQSHREILLHPTARYYGLASYRGGDGRDYVVAIFAN